MTNTAKGNVNVYFPFIQYKQQQTPTSVPSGTIVAPEWVKLEMRGTDLVGEWSPTYGANGVIYEVYQNTSPQDANKTLVKQCVANEFTMPLNYGTTSNLIQNGGFESGTLIGWNNYLESQVASVVSGDKKSGTYSAYQDYIVPSSLPPAPGDEAQFRTTQYQCTANTAYSVAVYLKVTFDPASVTKSVVAAIHWYSAATAKIDDHISSSTVATITGDVGWTLYTATVTAPANATHFRFGVKLASDRNKHVQYYIDDVSVVGSVSALPTTNFFAVRAVQADGTTSPLSSWLQPTQTSKQLVHQSAPIVTHETENFTIGNPDAMQITNYGLVFSGWSPEINPLAFATSTTATMTGDFRNRYTVGTRVTFIQSGTRKNFIVTSPPTYSAPSTTITLTGDNGATVANAAITDAYYSVINYPRKAVMWHGDSTVTAGNAIAFGGDSNQQFGGYYWQNTAANGDTFENTFFIGEGTYTFTAYGMTYTSLGKIDWYIDGTSIATAQDWYDGTGAYNAVKTVSNVSITGNGMHTLKGVVNGKNASSSGYAMRFTRFKFS